MKVSTKGRYALRFMLDVAVHAGDSCVTLRDAAQRLDISKKYMEQIALALTQAGLLTASRGQQGGYRLSAPADQITAWQVLHAVEICLAPASCSSSGGSDQCAECLTRSLYEGLDTVIREYLSAWTLQSILDNHDCSHTL